MKYCKQCGNEWDGPQTVCSKCGWDPATDDEDMDEDLLGGALDDMDDEWGEKTVALTPKQMEAALAASAGRTASGNAGSAGQGGSTSASGKTGSAGQGNGVPASGNAGSQQTGAQTSGAAQTFDIGAGASGEVEGDKTVVMTSAQVMSAMESSKTDYAGKEERFLDSRNGRIVVGVCIVLVVLIILSAL